MHYKSWNAWTQTLLVALLISLISCAAPNRSAAQTSSFTSSAGQSTVKWERYALKDRGFSVLLPTVPASHRDSNWHPYAKSRIRNQIGAYSKGIGYAVTIYDLKQSVEEFITDDRSGNFKREVSVSGIRGTEYVYEDDLSKRVTHYFVLNSRIYSFVAHASRLGNPDRDIPKFLESIRFAEATGGSEIVDGVGIQPSEDPPAESDEGAASRIYTGKEVTYKAQVFMKPEPKYTDDARKNAITGTVVLRAVFTTSGQVTNIRAVSGLPYGLTERAIFAARQIRFIPAIKDGRFVSTYIQLEYNFNLY